MKERGGGWRNAEREGMARGGRDGEREGEKKAGNEGGKAGRGVRGRKKGGGRGGIWRLEDPTCRRLIICESLGHTAT